MKHNKPARSRLRHKALENQWRATCRKDTLNLIWSEIKFTSPSPNSQSSPSPNPKSLKVITLSPKLEFGLKLRHFLATALIFLKGLSVEC